MTLTNQISPEFFVEYIKNHPALIISVLQRFETFKSFGNALDLDRQLILSNNLHRVNSFLLSQEGKDCSCLFVDSLSEFIKKDSSK